MKLGGISISTPRLLPGSYHPAHKYKPLLMEAGELSDGSGRGKVPKGSMAVYVGPQFRRFVIPISFLTMPDLRELMDRVAEEFGCDHHGALHIPCCDEDHFEHILMTCFARQRVIYSSNKNYYYKLKIGKNNIRCY